MLEAANGGDLKDESGVICTITETALQDMVRQFDSTGVVEKHLNAAGNVEMPVSMEVGGKHHNLLFEFLRDRRVLLVRRR